MQHFPLSNKLHTDVLEDKYGKINAKVLKHTSLIRKAHLVDPKGISRTFAMVFFPRTKLTKEISKINNEIKMGGAIGKIFRNYGYVIKKNVIDVFAIKIPKWLQSAFKTKENYAKARLSEFYARKKTTKPIIYGVVVEIYSPDFRSAVINKVDLAQINAPTHILEKKGFTKQEIWRRLGNKNNWSNVKEKYKKAKEQSVDIIFKLRKKIEKNLTPK